MRTIVLGMAATLGLTLFTTAPTPAAIPRSSADSSADSASDARPGAAKAVPALAVRRKVTGLDHPWDVRPIGDGRLLFTQRDRATVSVWANGHKRTVRFPSGSVWVSGETGLLGLEVDPRFASNGRFYTCQGGFTSGGGHDVRVLAWRLNEKATRATRIRQLVGGFPATTGRHAGCRLLIARDGSMYVGTGDGVKGTSPRNTKSLGGKTLRLNRFSGAPWPDNPFVNADNRRKRYVWTYGHRNVQGLAQRADGTVWSVEQGTDRNDEVNRLVKGGDYGWDPGPGYDEWAPMTDHSLPGRQIGARWRSGYPTLATSGGGFVRGAGWGALRGSLAVAALKAARVVFLDFDRSGRLQKVRVPAALRKYGRLRTVVDGPGAVIYVTTDNGNGEDAILAVRPRS